MADTTDQSQNNKEDVVELGNMKIVQEEVPGEPESETTNNSGNNEEASASNAAIQHAKEGGNGTAGARDNQRVASRANEAPDSTDTGSGGLSAGGGKSASQF